MAPSLCLCRGLQVANLKKESEFRWYKEDTEIIPDVKPDLGAGVCKLPIKLVIAPSNWNTHSANSVTMLGDFATLKVGL